MCWHVPLQGTLDQMAPEVLSCPDRSDPQLHKQRGDLAYGTPSDVWALGALAQELLMGVSPFAGLTQQEMIQVGGFLCDLHSTKTSTST